MSQAIVNPNEAIIPRGSLVESAGKGVRLLFAPCAQAEKAGFFQYVLLLTLVLVVLHPGDAWFVRVPMKILAIAGLIYRPFTVRPIYWLLMFGIFFSIQNVMFWNFSDNHKFVYSYWFLAIACSQLSQDPEKSLAANARLILGLVFLFASFRKLFAPEFMNGDTFKYLLLVDSRFSEMALALAHITDMESHAVAEGMFSLSRIISIPDRDRFHIVCLFLTWWTVIVEGAIAVGFLAFHSKKLMRISHLLLIYFIVQVYPVAPVLGFARILAILGFAQCGSDDRIIRAMYLIVFVLMEIFFTRHAVGLLFDLVSGILG